MAQAMRFPAYAVFDAANFTYDAPEIAVDVDALRRFWEGRVRRLLGAGASREYF